MRVNLRSAAYRVIMNPRKQDFTLPPGGLESAHRPEAPTVTVFSRPRTAAVRTSSFLVPRLPPGLYLILIYDGSEGGAHYTWDYFHLLGDQPAAAPRPAPERSPAEWVLGVLGAVMLAGGAFALIGNRT